jgi:hypothetical protein
MYPSIQHYSNALTIMKLSSQNKQIMNAFIAQKIEFDISYLFQIIKNLELLYSFLIKLK